MDDTRRKFLIKLGAASLFGLGSGAALTGFLRESAYAELKDEKPGESKAVRWGMLVDISTCAQGCSDCIEACHFEHNVPDFGNPKDEIKWIWKEKYSKVFPSKSHQFPSDNSNNRPVLTLCNHCENPPCVRVCPTKATFKREDGIVAMDFHRCIGCRFCMAGCPYGSRSFNWRDPRPFIKKVNQKYPTREKGVVEKCNFCGERIAKGKEPACVEACREKALVFGNLHDPDSEIRQLLKSRPTLQRKPELGTRPSVFYIFEGSDD